MMLEPREILRFAEGISDLNPDREEQLLSQVASSPDLRQKIAELRRDLYLVECQIPEYEPSVELLLEAEKLSRVWSNRVMGKETVIAPSRLPWKPVMIFLLAFFSTIVLFFIATK